MENVCNVKYQHNLTNCIIISTGLSLLGFIFFNVRFIPSKVGLDAGFSCQHSSINCM